LRRSSARITAALATITLGVSACTSSAPDVDPTSTPRSSSNSRSADSPTGDVRFTPSDSPTPTPTDTRPPGVFTFNFAGDVNFSERTATRLAADPSTAFGVAAAPLAAADLTMVNLETAITVGGTPERKSFTFQAPPTAFTALAAAGVDVATMANNHAADYGAAGLRDTLAAIATTKFPIVGIGANAAAAYAPWTTTVRGTKLAVIAATQVEDETLAHFTAEPNSPGVASAFSEALVASVQQAKAAGYVVVVYVHWGTEYTQCPNSDQTGLAATLSQAGAAAVIGTHAHVLQGAGWRADGTYIAYGLSNYLWWRSFGNSQDDNGILTLTFSAGKVVAASFAAAHLDATGVPVPAVGAEKARIDAQWETVRQCSGLAATVPQ
jgi:poly-gamma-glutamate synthesis protein (capsule biosynthesis protein)